MWMKVTIPLAFLVLFAIGTEAQTRRLRVRTRPVPIESAEEETSEEVNRPVQYYRKQDNAQELVYVNEEEYQNLYGGQAAPASRPRDYRPAGTTVRPLPRTATPLGPRTKEPETKAAPVQTIRNYNKVNDDGSFTFGYEAADGSFKEETRGTDCVVRGRYGYVDPEGNKREFSYVSGNPCDPNNPDGEEEEERNQSVEDSDENVPQNYPKRPVAPSQPRPRPTPAPTRAPTTVFQNRYNHQSLASEEEEDGSIQFAQIPKATPRPAFVQATQRPRVQVIQSTQAPQPAVSYAQQTPTSSINITPKPLYRIQNNALSFQQTPPTATTYRPQTVSYVTPKPALATTPAYIPKATQGVTFSSGSTRGAIDFDAEFKKFQHDNSGGFQPITQTPATQATKSVKNQQGGSSNPIYQTQLVYNPSSGQYDSALYQSIAQTDGEFSLNQRIQPYVQQYQNPQYQQQQYQAPQQQAYRPQPVAQPQTQQIPQQAYQKQQNELQFVNSQQLFAQQLQMQQSQLHRDRIEAAKKHQPPQVQAHRFQLQQSEQQPILRSPNGQQFYYLQPNAQSSGQIEAFLRGHNLEY